MAETVVPGVPGSDSIKVTDANSVGVPGGSLLTTLSRKAAARRDAAPLQRTSMMSLSAPTEGHPASGVMTVAPRPGRTVLDIDNQPYPPEGKVVPVGDVYAHRRLRDGSLLRINPEG